MARAQQWASHSRALIWPDLAMHCHTSKTTIATQATTIPEEVLGTSLCKHCTRGTHHGGARGSSAHHVCLNDIQWSSGCSCKGSSASTHSKVFLQHIAFMKLDMLSACRGSTLSERVKLSTLHWKPLQHSSKLLKEAWRWHRHWRQDTAVNLRSCRSACKANRHAHGRSMQQNGAHLHIGLSAIIQTAVDLP